MRLSQYTPSHRACSRFGRFCRGGLDPPRAFHWLAHMRCQSMHDANVSQPYDGTACERVCCNAFVSISRTFCKNSSACRTSVAFLSPDSADAPPGLRNI
eukprot:460958-Pyramimonas_sp.AAC.1